MQEYNYNIDEEFERPTSCSGQKDWFAVEGDLDDFIFYDPTGCEGPLYSDL